MFELVDSRFVIYPKDKGIEDINPQDMESQLRA